MFPYKEMAGTDLSKLYKGPPTTLTIHNTLERKRRRGESTLRVAL